MTRNRATKQAARTIATAKDIRMPDAAYLADHRKLLLLEDEPVVHDFSNGPLRFFGTGGLEKWMEEIDVDASAKGWRILTVTDPTTPGPSVDELRKEPTLLVVNVLQPYAPEDLDPSIVRLIEGGRPEVNVLVGLHDDAEIPSGLERGRNNRIDRLPGTAYLADHREIRLDDGTNHDFSTGPVRIISGTYGGDKEKTQTILNEAMRKGWRIINYPGSVGSAPTLGELQGQSTLVLVDLLIPSNYNPRDPLLVSPIEGEHEDINLLVTLHYSLAKSLSEDGWGRGRNIRVNQSAVPSQRDFATLQIAFARRYADMLTSGLSPQDALEFVTDDLASFIINGVPEMVFTLRQAHKDLVAGRSSENVWGPHREILGRHLVRMLLAGEYSGGLAQSLRQAAETLEADVRIGLA